MAKAKLKPECAICFDEEGSYACIRPAHDAYNGVVYKKDPTQPITKEILATSIIQISDAVKKLYDSGLNRHAVVALIADDTKMGKRTIEIVLDSLLELRKTYTK